jgi:hypothetical protein
VTHQPHEDVDRLIDAYVDGELTAAERRALEERARGDAGLRDRLGAQREVDARLRALFAPPARRDVPMAAGGAAGSERLRAALVGSAGAGEGGRGAGWGRRGALRLAVAACVLLALGVGWWWAMRVPRTRPDAVYARYVEAGFKPEAVCTTPKEFEAYTAQHLMQPVLPTAASGSGVEYVGWSYEGGEHFFKERTYVVVLLARSGGRPVLVFMGERRGDRGAKEGRIGTMNVFRRELGGAVLYEVTESGSPDVSRTLAVGTPPHP